MQVKHEAEISVCSCSGWSIERPMFGCLGPFKLKCLSFTLRTKLPSKTHLSIRNIQVTYTCVKWLLILSVVAFHNQWCSGSIRAHWKSENKYRGRSGELFLIIQVNFTLFVDCYALFTLQRCQTHFSYSLQIQIWCFMMFANREKRLMESHYLNSDPELTNGVENWIWPTCDINAKKWSFYVWPWK